MNTDKCAVILSLLAIVISVGGVLYSAEHSIDNRPMPKRFYISDEQAAELGTSLKAAYEAREKEGAQ